MANVVVFPPTTSDAQCPLKWMTTGSMYISEETHWSANDLHFSHDSTFFGKGMQSHVKQPFLFVPPIR